MRYSVVRDRSVSGVAAALTLSIVAVLLAIAPFAAALEIHHELAAADHDGHQHSDFDLCQWVQHHTSSSLQADAPVLRAFFTPGVYQAPPQAIRFCARVQVSGPPRGPPLF